MRVTNGLLPIKLNYGSAGREGDRMKLLVNSLDRHWTGATPFSLHIVCLDKEIDEVRAATTEVGASRLTLNFYKESEFFGTDSSFYKTHPTYKQQMIKLIAPARLGIGAFITFDADILCLRDFNEETFVFGEKLISTYEPKIAHSWWENGMAGCGLTTDLVTKGLGVTPNTLHSDLCVGIEAFFAERGMDCIERLYDLTQSHPGVKAYAGEGGHPLVWSEYSLYHMISEMRGTLQGYHVAPEVVSGLSVQLHSRRNVWGKDDIGRLQPDSADPGIFLIVQSWAGVPVEEILDRIGYK